MAEAVVSSTIEMLSGMLIQEASFLSGVKTEVEYMKTELQRMQCFLKDADKRKHEDDDEMFRNKVKSIRNFAYKIENVVESYAIEIQSRKGTGIKNTLKRCAYLPNEGVSIHNLGTEIRNIRNEIENFTKSLPIYDIPKLENRGESSNAAITNLLRQNFPHQVEEDFIGMEGDVCKLVSLMTAESDQDGRIISIHGMGGSGKTTLAKQVYNHVKVQNHFDSLAWAVVSQNFNAGRVLKAILRQLRKDKDHIKGMEYSELVEELCEAQREIKCLFVIDDIWETDHWEILSRAFNPKSKVLLTTRKKEVAEIGILHKPKVFTEDDGWRLLKRKALKCASDRGQEKEEHGKIGREIVGKCGYLPLAISVIGGILSKKETLQEWEMVNKNIDSYLVHGEGIEEKKHNLMKILSLSYEDLPYQLKPCFLYLAFYPEDEEILLNDLYLKWIAEGMVLPKDQRGDETLMEVAERYLAELVSRSLVQGQLSESSIISRYDSCHLHDLMRDLCIWKCKEEDFLDVVEFQDRKQVFSDLNPLAYRLVIYGEANDDNVYNKILQEANEGLRAYSLRNREFSSPIAYKLSENLRNFRFLRVVAFKELEFSDKKLLHKVIKCLIHIRFLSFVSCNLDEVPSSIAKLRYLQTFQLLQEGYLKIRPDFFSKLKTLMHLTFYLSCSSEGKLRLDGLTGLERFYSNNVEVKSLSKLINLREIGLYIGDNESLAFIISCIDEDKWCKVHSVRLLIQSGCDFKNIINGRTLLGKLFMCRALQVLDIWDVPIDELPKYESPNMLASSDLVVLSLGKCYILEDPMPMLEKLPKLKQLTLWADSFVGEELICSSFGFSNLRILQLCGLSNLKRWRIDEGAMPNLSEVLIFICLGLEMIPDGMKSLKALRKLKTLNMPQEFNNRICEEGADFDKVCHVPLISILSDIEFE